jgi:hypothetical protein
LGRDIPSDRELTYTRVKLPKSFLAVNLSESHTFHKKAELVEAKKGEEGESTIAEMMGENLAQQRQLPNLVAHADGENKPITNSESAPPGTLTAEPTAMSTSYVESESATPSPFMTTPSTMTSSSEKES